MQVSHAGLVEIEASEGWSSGPYWDAIGRVYTAYFGETKNIGPHSPKLTRAQGEKKLIQRFNADYAFALKPFESLSGFNQNMYDALASFIWNCGTGAVSANTTVGKRLRARDWASAANALLAWNRSNGKAIPGLTARRKRERTLFLKKPQTLVHLNDRFYLTSWEEKTAQAIEDERKVAKRYGGWDKINSVHLRNAIKYKTALQARIRVLKESDPNPKARRAERIRALTQIVQSV